MLLKLPSKRRIVASNTVATKVASPVEVLGGDWPSIANGSLPDENWWLLQLSGGTRVWFEMDRNGRDEFESFGLRVSREHIDYQLRPGIVDVQQSFSIDQRQWKDSPRIVKVTPGLRVESVTLNNEAVDWVANAASNSIEIRSPQKCWMVNPRSS